MGMSAGLWAVANEAADKATIVFLTCMVIMNKV